VISELLKSSSVSRSPVSSVFATRKTPVSLYEELKLILRLRFGRIVMPLMMKSKSSAIRDGIM
jgi:hypothetical protein